MTPVPDSYAPTASAVGAVGPIRRTFDEDMARALIRARVRRQRRRAHRVLTRA